MSLEEYKQEFINEAREHLDILNESLLILEKNPDDTENINKIFRSFHTLKGNSAAMGYIKFSELAHRLEDLLDKIRNKSLKPSEEIMNILFQGCDILEDGLKSIQTSSSDSLDGSGIISSVNKILEKKEEKIEVRISEKLPDEMVKEIHDINKSKMDIYRIIVLIDNDSPIKAAKILLVLRNMALAGTILKTIPSIEEITKAKFNDEIEIVLSSTKAKDDLFQEVNTVSGLQSVYVLGLDDPYTRTQETKKIADIQSAPAASEKKTAAPVEASFVKQVDSVKIDIKRLDNLVNLVGELLINKMRLNQIAKNHQIDELNRVMKLVGRLTDDIQNEVMQARMVPIGNIFARFPRMVRDLARKENKNINLITEGEDIEFDRNILDELGEPLLHMLRNCVDHGIESPDERANKGKPEIGTIKLIAKREKNDALIIVSDDGAGIDPKKVKAALIKKGIANQAETDKMNDDELKMLIFRPGASTNEEVTEVSGRGVGMNVVQTKIKSLGGTLKLDSEIGNGTTFIMKLPLTVSIVTCLQIEANKRIYAIPLANVDKTLSVNNEEIKTIKGNAVINYMGKEIALLDLRKIFGYPDVENVKKTVVVVDKAGEPVAIIVDRIISQEQILIKKLEKTVKSVKGIAGSTILGDGTVGLVLDVNTLF